eukprot:gene14604-17268_t
MDDFETAVLYSFDPQVSEDIKQKALAYTEGIKSSPDGWRFCLDRLFVTSSIHVKFFCFHVFQDLILHRHAILTEDDRTKLKTTLVNYLKVHLAVANEDSAIKNKYAQIVVLLFKQEYPEQWPSFFNEFLVLLQLGPPLIDIFLRILRAIDEEVVSFDVHRSTAELAHNTHIVRFKSWYNILMVYHTTNPTLANMALKNIKYYVGWIDINLIVNDQFIPLFCKLLNSKPLREEVCDCFKEIINKGMDFRAKLSLIQQLQINDIVNFVVLDDLEFVVKIGSLINLTGMEVLRGLESSGSQQDKKFEGGEILLEQMLELLLKFLNNEFNEVSMTVMSFSALYITKLKNTKPLNEKQLKHITLLVQIVRNKMKYSKNFDFKHPDGEEELQFLEFRKDLSNQFRNIFRICPEMVGSFVHNLVTNIVQEPTAVDFTDLEVAIYLLFQMGEGLSATPEETMKQFERFFGSMVVVLSTSMSLIYFETVVRYAKFIPGDSGNLGTILASFLDGRGIHCRNSVVRSRAGYLLNKLVKQLKVQLFPFINNIIESLKNHLIISYEIQKEVPFEEQLNFYESLGLLIGGANLPQQEEQNYVERILLSPYKRMEEIITKGLYKTDTKELPFHSTQLYQLISAIGTFSKGFSPMNLSTGTLKPEPCAYKIYFTKSLEFIIQIPNLLPLNDDLKSRTFFYMHRMVDCLGNDLRPMLVEILPTLLNYTTSYDSMVEYITFVNQLMAKHNKELYPIINDCLRPIVLRVFKVLEQPLSVPDGLNTDEERSRLELQKTYYAFIHAMINYSLGSTFTSPANINIFEQILSTVINGCTVANDGIQKTSFSIIRRCIEEYGQGGSKAIEGFAKFIYSQVLPVCFTAPMQAHFNMNDVTSNQILTEIGKSLKIIANKYGDDFINYVANVYLPSINVQQPQVIQQFTRLLATTSSLKDFQDTSLVLTHFCETHGPSVVFTTQSEDELRWSSNSLDDQENNNNNAGGNGQTAAAAPSITLPHLFTSPKFKRLALDISSGSSNIRDLPHFGHHRVQQHPDRVVATHSVNVVADNGDMTTSSLPPASTTPVRCPTCSSLMQGQALVSQDSSNASVYYVSTHQPSNSSYSHIRNACVRSLSCELVPGREGPVFIANNDGSCLLSYMFKINDSRARGSARWYGFLFMLGEASCLVNYFGWIVHCFRVLAEEMKARTNVVFEKDKLTAQPNQAVLSSMYRRTVRTTTLRPLTELLEDSGFFARLHHSFASILSTCHLKHHLLQNAPPILDEQMRAIEALKRDYSQRLGRPSDSANGGIQEALADRLTTVFPIAQELVVSLGQVLRIIGNSISALIYNVITGNQVIIQGRSPALIASLIDLLRDLIPDECCSVCYYSETFKEIWECNILGLAPKVIIPRHVDRDVLAIVDLDYYDKSLEPEDIDNPYRSTIEISFSGPYFVSSLGQTIEAVLRQNYPPKVEKIHLLAIKEEWIKYQNQSILWS